MAKSTQNPRRKKPAATAPAAEKRGTKLSCTRSICNAGKWSQLQPLFDRVCALKNQMSAYVHQNALRLISDAYALASEYKRFPSSDLLAWERQALFQDIVGAYTRSLNQRLKTHPFILQKRFTCQRHQKAGVIRTPKGAIIARYARGQPKEDTFVLERRQSTLTRLATYLLRVNLALFDPHSLPDEHKLKAAFLRVTLHPERWDRLKRVARQRQARLLAGQTQVHYVTGTFRVNPKESRISVVVDPGNGQYPIWLKLRFGVGAHAQFEYFPLLVNEARLRKIAHGDIQALGLAKELRLKLTANRKLHVCTTYDAPALAFTPPDQALGLDLNTKRSFMADSQGAVYQLDADVLTRGLALLDRFDRAGGVSRMGYRAAAQLRQWLRQNEASVKRRLAAWCDAWKAQGFTDLWLEDLAMFRDATFIRHPLLGEKYSRVLRLMRLSAVKDWLFSIAEKRQLRVHTTHAAYTSQECPRCHHVSRANRPTQAQFHCACCGLTGDADHIAGINIKNRRADTLRELLHEKDEHGRCSPRPIRRSALKALLSAQAQSAGGVTELLTPALPTKPGGAVPCSSRSSAYSAVGA